MHDMGFVQFNTGGNVWITGSATTLGESSIKIGSEKNIKKQAKPIEVWEILKDTTEPLVDCSELDEKIKIIKNRIETLTQYTDGKDLEQEEACLFYLTNRKKYEKYKNDFAYPTTSMSMMKLLCEEYTLKIANINQYSGTMPKEAIDELAKYTKAFKKLTDTKPLVKLIVPEKDFKTEEKKRDPILLAESPFGNWFYILGAWDKEVLIVDELIYGI